MDGYSKDIVKEDIEKLRSIFPQCVVDGKVKIDQLLNILGEYEERDFEKYEFTWKGKNECYKVARERTKATLLPCESESVNFNDTENLYIEGDNLEVLKILQQGYYNKIKMIYIDPPYNTGNDFVYKDNYKDSIANYKNIVSSTGKSNPETSGRFHTDWLNMMFPRLMLAHTLLKDDGVIFISIDDNEVDNLKKMCNEIFGENNFVTQISWECLDTIKNDAKYFSDNNEYIICYAKNIEKLVIQGIKKGEKQEKYYRNYDNDERGKYLLTPLHAKSGTEASLYTYIFSNGQVWEAPKGTYPRFSKETLKNLEMDNRIYLDPTGKKVPQKKTFLSEVGDRMPPKTFWSFSEFGSTRQSNKELSELIGKGIFQNSKPSKLIKIIIDIIKMNKDDIILDFFSGSATTAHAVMQVSCLLRR